MRWRGGRRSTNIEDRRGKKAGLLGGGIGTVVVILAAMYFGIDPNVLMQGLETVSVSTSSGTRPAPKTSRMTQRPI